MAVTTDVQASIKDVHLLLKSRAAFGHRQPRQGPVAQLVECSFRRLQSGAPEPRLRSAGNPKREGPLTTSVHSAGDGTPG